jgi:type VI secretion system protein ImpK
MAATVERRVENLAFLFQEVITVVERLRSGRQQVTDANMFRHQIREALKLAVNESRKRGYTEEDSELAKFAVVAFVDETILNLRNPIFADWPRQPLQEEYYHHHIAGEVYFQHLQKLMVRDETQETADVLEVYHLILLLGFAGRYSMSGRGELRSIIQTVGEKIQRIRQMRPELSPYWMVPNDQVVNTAADPWVKRLVYIAASCAFVAILLFVLYKLMLGSGVSSLDQFAQVRR